MALNRLFINRYFDVQGLGNKYVSNFYNDSTGLIEVYAGDSPQPDTNTPNGAAIPGGFDDPTANIPSKASYKFCDGSTLNEFQLNSEFPYALQLQTANSYQCVTTVCDLQIEYVEKIKNASDYTIRIKATSSNGPITYSLNNVDYQSSNEFTGQDPGTLTVYAKDANGCLASSTITLDEFPVYGEKYSYQASSRLENDVELKIYQLGWEGSVSTISYIGADKALAIGAGKRGDDKYEVFKTSQLVFSPHSEVSFEWFDFQTASELDYKCELLINDSVVWTGFINPSLTGEPLISAPYISKLSFIDGLKLLKDFDYEEFQGRQSALTIINYCLDRLGFDLDIYEGVNFFEAGMQESEVAGFERTFMRLDSYDGKVGVYDGSLTGIEVGDVVTFANLSYGEIKGVIVTEIIDDLQDVVVLDLDFITGTDGPTNSTISVADTNGSGLDQAYLNTDAFEGMNYYEVLEEVLKTYKARIFQYNNKWWILNVNQQAATFKLRKFESDLTFIESEEVNRGQVVGKTEDFFFINKAQFINNEFSIKKATISQDYLTVRNLLKGSDFKESDFSSGSPLEWFGNAQTKKAVGEEEDKFSMGITGTASAASNATYMRQDFKIQTSISQLAGGSFCELKFKYYVASPDSYVEGDSLQVGFKLKATTNDDFNIITNFQSAEQWLSNNNYLEVTESFYLIEVTEFNRWHDFSLNFHSTGIGQDWELSLIQAVTSDYSVTETRYSNISFEFLPENEPAATEQSYVFDNLDYPARNKREDKVIFGDAPLTQGNATIYQGAITLQNGTPTQAWSQGGDDTDARQLHKILVNEVLKNFKKPSIIVSGSIQQNTSEPLNLDGFLVFTDLPNMYFTFCYVLWDVLKERYEIEYKEIITEATFNVFGFKLETEDYYLLENEKILLLENN